MEKLCIDLTCPNLPFAEHILTGSLRLHLKTGNWLKDFSIVYLKSGKGLTGFFYGALKNRKLVDFIILKSCRMS